MVLKHGFDIHGVLDTDAQLFQAYLGTLVAASHEVHIISGPPLKAILADLDAIGLRQGVHWTHTFSVVDYHVKIGTPIDWRPDGAHMDAHKWDSTKGQYCEREGIHIHWDDSDTYGYFFKTPYLRYYSKQSDRVRKLRL